MIGVLAFAILTVAGLPLSALLCGLRAETIAVAPILGAGFAATAAVVEVGLGGSPLALVTIALCLGVGLPLAMALRHPPPFTRPTPAEVGLFVVPGALLVWALVPLTWFRLSYDARLIWLLHARLLYAGHGTYLDHARLFPFSHPDYPPLTSSAVAFDWLMRGSISYRDGQVVIGLLTAAGTLLVAIAAARITTASARLRPVIAGTVVVLCYGLWGTYATDGYADPLLTSLVLTALIYALFLVPRHDDPSSTSPWLVPVLVVLASLTKNEGFVYGVIVLVAASGRELVGLRGRGLGRGAMWTAIRPSATRYGAALAAMSVWPIVVRARGITSNLTGDGGDDREHRLHRTVDALWHGVDATALGLVGLIVVAVFVRALRSAVVAFIVALALTAVALVLTYTFGPDPIDKWLHDSIDRTDMLLRLAGLVGAVLTATVATSKIKHRESHASR